MISFSDYSEEEEEREEVIDKQSLFGIGIVGRWINFISRKKSVKNKLTKLMKMLFTRVTTQNLQQRQKKHQEKKNFLG